MDDLFADLFEGLEGLSLRRRSLRQAAVDASLIQQGVFDAPTKTRPKLRTNTGSPSGKPRTGGKPKTGARLIDTSLLDEWKKRKLSQAGGGGGAAPASRSKPSGAKPLGSPSPAAAAAAMAARVKVASGSQAAVVKIASYAAGGARVNALVQYQGRKGELALEREDGSTIKGSISLAALAREWTGEEPERKPTKDVLRLALDVEGGQYRGRGGQVQIETALRQALPGHRFAWASEDRPDGTTRVEIVMSAAARRQGDDGKAIRVFDNRKSLAQLENRFDRAFGTETDMDVRGFAHGVEGTARYLTQLTHGGTRMVQSICLTRDGRLSEATTLIGHDANLKEARDWKRDLRSKEQRDVAHIILSAKPGTDKQAFVEAARAMLPTEFAGHEYAFALHEDREHIHVHAVVRMKAQTGERIDPKIQDLQRWRETLAHEARERHIPMEALSRFERSNPPGYKLKDIRRVERGVASESVRRRVDAVRSGTPHIPVREEGRKRARAVLQGWRDVESIAASRSFEPTLAAGATRLYRADRPGAASTAGAALTSAPQFTRDREAATRMAERSSGSVAYIDVSPAELAALKPARTDVFHQFVVSPELASTRRPLDQPSTATILKFRNRAEQAVAGAAQREASRQPETTGVTTDMPNLDTMQSAFDDINEQMKVVEETLPVELLPQVETVRKKMGETQRNMLNAQQNIERKRGAVEGGRYVEPVPKDDLAGFASERRGDTIRYSHLSSDGEIGRIAFVDNGKKVEIHDWKDRQAVLAAMRLSTEKWGDLTVTGTSSYKALVVELAAEHGFQIANPELQDQIRRETERLDRRQAERPGFTAGNVEKSAIPMQTPASPAAQVPPLVPEAQSPSAPERAKPQSPSFTDTGAMVGINDSKDRETVRAAMQEEGLNRSSAETTIALETVRTKSENEASRETRQAAESSRTNEKPIDGGGSDHAYRTQAEAGAARRAQNAVEMDPKRPMPTDINQSPQVERLAQEQAELLKQKQETEKAQTQKNVKRQKQ
ncbi:LPD7 domain-containing protein [Phyllobacterium brassicacearum]|nr:LPD7 domain-containing protein [Phyllobacterium brassicacearum]TDQ15330.1 relaxase/mobilization nuclease-like protein [Phyllobacterium brassicacearum]